MCDFIRTFPARIREHSFTYSFMNSIAILYREDELPIKSVQLLFLLRPVCGYVVVESSTRGSLKDQ